MPMHTGCARVVFLKAIHADVALAGRRIFCKDERQGYKSSAVLWPAFQNRDLVERGIDFDDFLARRILDVLWKVNRLVRSRDD